MLVTAGRPCGPCCGIRKAIYLRKGALFIALFEIFFSSIVIAACMGTLVSHRLNYKELKDAKVYNEDNIYWLNFACIWQTCCYTAFLILGVILLCAHINRELLNCKIYIIGEVLVGIVSLVGIGFTLLTLYVFDALIVLLFLRIYFVWVVLAYYLEIKLNPDGLPPPPRPVVVVKEPESEIVVKESSVRYMGDG